jgi:acetylornithine deacetylase/succinyl-diaminopimelate desuccinylase-like protein
MAHPTTARLSNTFRILSTLTEITEHASWRRAVRCIQEQREWLDNLQIALTEIPAPTFQEAARAQSVADRFRELGLQRVRLDKAGNALGERPGANSAVVVIAAHLDTVTPAGVPIEVKRANGRLCAPGISDNGAGLAAMLGIAAALQRTEIATDHSLLFAATAGEEGEGDLYGMRHLFSQPELCRRTAGVFVLDGSSTEQITVAGLGSRRFRVEVTGPGGHSWSDFERVNPIRALASAITELGRIPLPAQPRSSLNVAMIHGGTAVNAIPQSAWMKVDIRSTCPEEIERLVAGLEAAVRVAVEQESRRGTGNLAVNLTVLGDRPVAELPKSARILRIVQEADRHLGIRSRLERSSTDANIPLSLGIEAIATGGGGTSGDAHTLREWYDPRGRELGLKRLLLAILMMAGMVAEEQA